MNDQNLMQDLLIAEGNLRFFRNRRVLDARGPFRINNPFRVFTGPKRSVRRGGKGLVSGDAVPPAKITRRAQSLNSNKEERFLPFLFNGGVKNQVDGIVYHEVKAVKIVGDLLMITNDFRK